MRYSKLIEQAINAQKNAYAPYSNFKVGAAVLCKNGKVFAGCNVENSSYPVSSCAERTTICKAVSEGEKDFVAIAIVGGDLSEYCFPCGMCRQLIVEFNADMDVIVARSLSDYQVYKASELLTHHFKL